MDPKDSEPHEQRKPYEAPAVIYEATLEVRAGSPLGILPDLTDPAGLFGPKK